MKRTSLHLAVASLALAQLAARPLPHGVFAAPRAEVDVNAAIDKVNQAFEAFKAENDRKLNGKADVVTDEKVERINASVGELQAALDTQARQIAALKLNGAGDDNVIGEIKADPEYVGAFRAHMRKGRGRRLWRSRQQ